MRDPGPSPLTLRSSDHRLVEGFEWAKAQAMAYVFRGDPVGDWYEAALPGREAFCMRDVSHQSTGAQVLGLAAATRNMLRRFAENISPSRDWCTYWEINRHNLPAPVDYASDSDFWYNLPSNFDVLDCCWRQYLWTGDRTYLDDPVFRNFYDRTLDEYVRAWDKDGDGILEHYPEYGRRGIASYAEDIDDLRIGGDQIALQFAAYRAHALMYPSSAGEMLPRAERLREVYERDWWDEGKQRFAGFRWGDGSTNADRHGCTNCFPLLTGLVSDDRKALAALEYEIATRDQLGCEERSYMPELLYRYGRDELAYSELMVQTEPGYEWREYPEVSYAVVGSIAAGLIGIEPDARTRTITSRSRLPAHVEWVELSGVPVFGNVISVRHEGRASTTVTNLSGPVLRWMAASDRASILVELAPNERRTVSTAL